MKRLFILGLLFTAGRIQGQTGEATVAMMQGIGASTEIASPPAPGLTKLVACQPSCKVVPTRIYISDEKVSEADGIAYLVVSISPSSSQTVSVKYKTVNGSAKQGKDYTKASGSLSFSPGQAFKKLPLSIIADTDSEPQEDFFVELSAPVNSLLSDGTGKVTIEDVSTSRPGLAHDILFAASVKPNPSTSEFLISVTGASTADTWVELYDGIGRQIDRFTMLQGKTLAIGKDLKPGIYLVRLTRGSEVETLKLVKL